MFKLSSKVLSKVPVIVSLMFSSTLILSSTCFAQGESAAAQVGSEEPDLKKEERFFKVYSNFNSEPTSEEAWGGVTQDKAQTYKVQKGDTLWGVSQTLFADPQYWPKVWSLNNEEIENPHEILPDQEVKFFAGTMGEAPSLKVGEAGAEVEGESAPQAEEVAEERDPMAGIDLPPGKPSAPIGSIPASVPSWQYRKDRKNELIMDVEKINRDFGVPEEVLTYFLQDQETQEIGKIVETEMGLSSAGEFQYVFVELPKGLTDRKLLVVKDIGSVEDSVEDTKGQIVQVQGEIEVIEVVNQEKNMYRAIVKRLVAHVEVGGKLISGEMPRYNARQEGEKSIAVARVIGGQYDRVRKLFGTTNILFLSGKGMAVGQTYPVFKIQKSRVSDSKSVEGPRQIGLVKVVNMSQNFATAVVLQATEDIHVGDVTDPQTKLK